MDTHVFPVRKPLWDSHSDLRAVLRELIRAPETRDWTGLDAPGLLELDPGELLGNSFRAWPRALRKVGHHRAVVVVWAQSGITRGPEARAVPINDHGGPGLGFGRNRGRTRNLIAGNLEKEHKPK